MYKILYLLHKKDNVRRKLCTVIKSQVLANFEVDFSTCILVEAKKEVMLTFEQSQESGMLFTDGSSNVKMSSL